MRLRRPVFAAWIWIALCAVLMAALAPSVSHMLAGRGDAAGPACSMPEHRMMQMAAARDGTKPAGHAMDMDDCGYCSMQGHLPMLPGVAAAAPLLLDLVRAAPPLFFIAPRPLDIWLHARSRAPPGPRFPH